MKSLLGSILLAVGVASLILGVIWAQMVNVLPGSLLGLFSYKIAISVFGGAIVACYGLALEVLGKHRLETKNVRRYQ